MKSSIFLILDNIRSLYNIGSLFRTADAFGVKKIYLCGISAYPPHRQMEKIAKTSLGAEKSVVWEYHKNTVSLIKKLRSEGCRIAALETRSGHPKEKSLRAVKPTSSVALVLGNEIRGIHSRILNACDVIIYIPQAGKKESLNVAVAGAIALFALTR